MRRVFLAAVLVLMTAAACGGSGGIPFPQATPFAPALEQRLHGIRDRVAEIRGLPVYEVKEGIVSPQALQEYVSAHFETLSDDEKLLIESLNVVLRMLKLIGPEHDLAKYYGEDVPTQILGLYLEEENRLVLVGEQSQEISMSDELTLAHEYVHSLQDGAFDLNKFREKWSDSELERDGYSQYWVTLDCLIEGDATYTTELYAEAVFGSDWREKVDEEAATGGESQEEAPDLPEFLIRDSAFKYGDCAEFVRQLHEEGGWEAVNAAYRNPPDTTEQVLHLEKYRAGQLANTGQPVDLTELLEGWEMIGSAQFGEFDVFNYVVTLLQDGALAAIAAEGWGSGWSRSYRDESDPARVVVQLSLGWDSEDDLMEFLAVYGLILESLEASLEFLDDYGTARWTLEGQHGVLVFDRARARSEIRIAADAEALTAATADFDFE